MNPLLPKLRFNAKDVEYYADRWGFNCGPGAICAVTGMTPRELRPFMDDFESKRYTNPTLMWRILRNLGVSYKRRKKDDMDFPGFGLARIQWEGPWTKPGVPIVSRYRHTHWVAACSIPNQELAIFDVNCVNAGGWVTKTTWAESVVPWLLGWCEPEADGKWHITHSVEIDRDAWEAARDK